MIWEFLTEDDSAEQGSLGICFNSPESSVLKRRNFTNPRRSEHGWSRLSEARNATLHWPDARRHARVGFPQFTHSALQGADSILVELTNDDVEAGPGISFLLGRLVNSTPRGVSI